MFQKYPWLCASLIVGLVACGDKEDGDTGSSGGDDTANVEDSETIVADYGPENSWYHVPENEIPSDLEGTGQGSGDIAANLNLSDQFGDLVELYQFYGLVIVLDIFAEW